MRFSAAVIAVMLLALVTHDSRAQLGAGRGQNSDQPINIASDTLEVQQDKQVAIFKGKVDVVQGDTRLRSDELFVHYRERNAAQPAGAPQPQRPAGPTLGPGGPDTSSITRIEAKGNVFVSTPKERGQGNLGIYDVEKKTITLTGDVLLTSDQSTVRCARAVMYQNTGRSICEPATDGRVRAVIIPNSNNAAPQPATPGQPR
jgi:lipopolysaccharide export system protein LptA